MPSAREIVYTLRTIDDMSDRAVRLLIQKALCVDPQLIIDLVEGEKEPTFNVYLGNYDNKIQAVKGVRQNKGVGLAEAKKFVEGDYDFFDSEPFMLYRGVSEETAAAIKLDYQRIWGTPVVVVNPKKEKYASNPHVNFKVNR